MLLSKFYIVNLKHNFHLSCKSIWGNILLLKNVFIFAFCLYIIKILINIWPYSWQITVYVLLSYLQSYLITAKLFKENVSRTRWTAERFQYCSYYMELNSNENRGRKKWFTINQPVKTEMSISWAIKFWPNFLYKRKWPC